MILSNDPISGEATHTVRPPGALPDLEFREACVQCHDCRAVCPLAAIALDASGYPYLADARRCAHCGLCADVCSRQAIRFTDRTRRGMELVRAIERSCPGD